MGDKRLYGDSDVLGAEEQKHHKAASLGKTAYECLAAREQHDYATGSRDTVNDAVAQPKFTTFPQGGTEHNPGTTFSHASGNKRSGDDSISYDKTGVSRGHSRANCTKQSNS